LPSRIAFTPIKSIGAATRGIRLYRGGYPIEGGIRKETAERDRIQKQIGQEVACGNNKNGNITI